MHKRNELYKFISKTFLTDEPGESGAISCHVMVVSNGVGKVPEIDCELRIQDCSRPIYLDFNMYSDSSIEAYQRRVKKIDTLIGTLLDFKEAFINARDIYNTEANKLKKDEYIPMTGDIIDATHPDDVELVYHRDVEVVGVVTKPNDDVPSYIVIWDNKLEPMVLHWEDWKFVKSSVDTQTPSV